MSVMNPDDRIIRRPIQPPRPDRPPKIVQPVEPREPGPIEDKVPSDPDPGPPEDTRPEKPEDIEGYTWVWDGTKWVAIKTGETAEDRRNRELQEDEQRRGRQSARDYMLETFRAFGFNDNDLLQLGTLLDQWIMVEGLADLQNGSEIILNRFRKTDIYQRRFAGMAELSKRGQAISEAEYIELERSYRNVMSNYGLPSTYYDNYDDYARMIGAGLSVREVEERVVAAKQAMNPLVAQELKQYFDVTDGDLTAYMLGLTDEKGLQTASARNQEEIRQRGRLAQIGAAAERAGFSMDRAAAERLAGTSIGQTIDPFQMNTLAQLEGTFNQARRVADRETTLAGIDGETFDQRDALASAFGDRQTSMASERRAKRERARFAGSGGASSGSLAVERNF